MGVVYIAFILATGYVFSTLSLPASHKLSKAAGWVPYFQVAMYGFVFFIFTLPLLLFIDLKDYARHLSSSIGFKYYHYSELGISLPEAKMAVWAIASMFLALLSGFISWLIHKVPSIRNRAVKASVRGDVLDSVIYNNTQSNLNKFRVEKILLAQITSKHQRIYK